MLHRLLAVMMLATPGCRGEDAAVARDAVDAATAEAMPEVPSFDNPAGSGASRTVTIGADGGEIGVGLATLVVPANALGSDTPITITESTTPVPSDLEAATPLYVFSPDTLEFKLPVQIRFAYPAGRDDAIVNWSRRMGPGYEAISTWREGAVLFGEIRHFSSGFVGFGGFTLPVDTGTADSGADTAVTDTLDATVADAADATVADAADASDASDDALDAEDSAPAGDGDASDAD